MQGKPLFVSIDSDQATKLGEVAEAAVNAAAIDDIDRGLILVRLLKEAGFDVYKVDRRYRWRLPQSDLY